MNAIDSPVLKPCIAIVGPGRCDAATSAQAEEVGRRLAERRFTLVCGGLGGVMEAACRGAKQAGGFTIGILPGTTASDANRWVDLPIVTGMGEARNVIIVRTAQAVIAIAGEFGTLSEIAFALKLGRPVIGLQTWELGRAGRPVQAIRQARTPEEAVNWIALAHESADRDRSIGRSPGQ